MNTATRALYNKPSSGLVFSWPASWSWSQSLISILMVLVVFSAFGIVYVKDLNRRLSINLQQQQSQIQQAKVLSGKLLLEKSTVSRQSRVQTIAENDLGMVMPNGSNSVLLKLKDLPNTPSYPIYSSRDADDGCTQLAMKDTKSQCLQKVMVES
jgi:cell division protein FtsL